MKVFLSWSGATSLRLANILRDWLPLVVPNAEPFVSAEDIDKGARPFSALASELQSSAFGILCITRENMAEPWIHFEAGALSKTIGDGSHVCPLLFGLRVGDLDRRSPLIQFQATAFEREDFLRMTRTLAKAVDGAEPKTFQMQFDHWWEKLREEVHAALSQVGAEPTDENVSRTDRMLEEILRIVRGQAETLPESVAAAVASTRPYTPFALARKVSAGRDIPTSFLVRLGQLLPGLGAHDMRMSSDQRGAPELDWFDGPSERVALSQLLEYVGDADPEDRRRLAELVKELGPKLSPGDVAGE